eukprot:4263831-Amphidinium_carterae.1
MKWRHVFMPSMSPFCSQCYHLHTLAALARTAVSKRVLQGRQAVDVLLSSADLAFRLSWQLL